MNTLSVCYASIAFTSPHKTNPFQAVGRDSDGVEYDGENRYTARCAMFKLYGNRILEGYYEIILDKKNMAYLLRERFPQLEDSETDVIPWNEYELSNVSTASVGNPKLLGYQ